MRERPYLLFFGLAAGAFVIADIVFEIFARLWVGRNTPWEAVSEPLYYSAKQPVGTLMLLSPFLLLAWMSASLATKKTLRAATVLFVSGAVALGIIYFSGHLGAEQAMHNHKWTAAALSVGLLPLQSIPILFIIFIIRLIVGRKDDGKRSQ